MRVYFGFNLGFIEVLVGYGLAVFYWLGIVFDKVVARCICSLPSNCLSVRFDGIVLQLLW